MPRSRTEVKPGDVMGPQGQRAVLSRGRTPGEWMLSFDGRVRWGLRHEILEDIAFFQAHGKLPDRRTGGF